MALEDVPQWVLAQVAQNLSDTYIAKHITGELLTEYNNTAYGAQQTDEGLDEVVFRGLAEASWERSHGL